MSEPSLRDTAKPPAGYERLFKELSAAVEAADQAATKMEGEDGFIRGYVFASGPWHRVLAAARNGLTGEEARRA